MTGITIPQLPGSNPLTGSELIPVSQGGVTVSTTASAIGALSGGAAPRPLRRVTAAGPVQVTKTDDIVVIVPPVAATVIVNLPATPALGEHHTIKDGSGLCAVGTPFVIMPAAGLIDGQATLRMTFGFESVNVEFDGTQWGGY